MPLSITLNQLRTQYRDEIYTDPQTGTRYTVDTLGNPIIIVPDKPAGELGPGEEPTYEKAAKSMEPDFMYTGGFDPETGEMGKMYETDIRPYLFDPTLIQREADLALLSGKAAPGAKPIGTEVSLGEDWEERRFGKEKPEMERATFTEPETGFTRLMPGAEGEPEKVSEEEAQKIKAASRRIDEGAGITPPGQPGEIEEGAFDPFDPEGETKYKNFLIERFGGDPNLINPHEEVQKLFPDSKVEQWYMNNWTDKMPTWYDLADASRKQLGTKLRSDLLSEYMPELNWKKDAFNKELVDYRKRVDGAQKVLTLLRREAATQKKHIREADTVKGRENKLQNDILRFKKQRDETFDETRQADIQAHIDNLESQLKEMRSRGKPGAEDKEKPISTAPAWAGKFVADKKIDPKNFIRSAETKKGKFVEIKEDGKKVTWVLPKGSDEWVTLESLQKKPAAKKAAVAGAKGITGGIE